jgi:hypothetical protein
MAHTSTNIHGVKAIRIVPKVFGSFVAHDVVFELEDGEVHVSGFSPKMLAIEIAPAEVITEQAA